MDTNERIKTLCKNNGITVQQLEIDLGEKPSSISKTTSNSKAEKLYKIAKYFNTSMEYLMTGEEAEMEIILTREERDIIEAYRIADDTRKDIIADILKIRRQDTGLQLSSRAG